MNNLELIDNLLAIADDKEISLNIENFNSFTDVKLDSNLSNITGSGKGNVVDEDRSIDFEKSQRSIDEIKKLFI